jgi:hypothetical protein
MPLFDFFQSHAGKAVIGVFGAVFLLAWPPALPWIAAVALLQFGVRHIVLAFKEVEREEQNHIAAGAPSLPAPDGERRIAGARHSAVPARSLLD